MNQYLMHFCSSSRCYVTGFLYTSKYFRHCHLFFSAADFFLSHVLAQASFSPLSGFCTLFQVFCARFLGLCHVLRSSILGLYFLSFYLLSDNDANLIIITIYTYRTYRISSNKRRASNKRRNFGYPH